MTHSAYARTSITPRRSRADAAFAILALFYLLGVEGWDHAIRIKGNSKLHERNDLVTKRGPGRWPQYIVRDYAMLHYRAESWSKPQRVVAKIEFHPGKLFPRVGLKPIPRRLVGRDLGRGYPEPLAHGRSWPRRSKHLKELTAMALTGVICAASERSSG